MRRRVAARLAALLTPTLLLAATPLAGQQLLWEHRGIQNIYSFDICSPELRLVSIEPGLVELASADLRTTPALVINEDPPTLTGDAAFEIARAPIGDPFLVCQAQERLVDKCCRLEGVVRPFGPHDLTG